MQLGHASKRLPKTATREKPKKKKYPCSFTPEELKEFDDLATIADGDVDDHIPSLQ